MPKKTSQHQPAAVTKLDAHETVVLYPTFGHRMPGNSNWRLTISGTVYEPEKVSLKSRILLRLLRRVLGGDDAIFESELFNERIQHFTAGTEKGKRVAIRIGDQVFRLPKRSQSNGHFSARVRVTTQQIERWEDQGLLSDGWLDYEVVPRRNDSRTFRGSVQLIEPYGVSVISDIDDTVKHTIVRDRREMLANTFLRPFQEIGGMSELYQSWAEQGMPFHYVSSSPWQLFSALETFRDGADFPDGSFHLRSFRLRDHMLRRLLLIRRKGKGATIRSILKRFPGRSFILVGDSGERDPEIYGAVARRHPEQVSAIYIRQVDGRPLRSSRQEKAFRHLDEASMQTFKSPVEISEDAMAGA